MLGHFPRKGFDIRQPVHLPCHAINDLATTADQAQHWQPQLTLIILKAGIFILTMLS